MREIRFRFWDKEEKKMRYSGDAHCPELTANGCPVAYMTRENLSMRYDVLQFTGLKDKNGVEIFEGDIIKFSINYGSKPICRDIVQWSDGRLAWSLKNRAYLLFPMHHHEVIGNILEHPHLLEVTNGD